jgi:hypothetical protein
MEDNVKLVFPNFSVELAALLLCIPGTQTLVSRLVTVTKNSLGFLESFKENAGMLPQFRS